MTKYAFDSYDMPASKPSKKKHHRRQHSSGSGGGDDDPTDGNGSLTYSAASSINSAAGESTDSSLAGIMRVLDVQDSKELAAVLEKERIKKHHQADRSVAAESQHSLAYSTDAESHMKSLATEQSGLKGTGLLGTIAGQTSDQYSYDGGNYHPGQNPHANGDFEADNDMDLMFAPAEHSDSLKRRKEKKRREKKDAKMTSNTQIDNQTPRVKNSKKSTGPSSEYAPNSSSRSTSSRERYEQQESQYHSNGDYQHQSRSSSSRSSPNKKAARPPKVTRENLEMQEEEDVWYAKWWMFCFPDTVKTMTPKR